jgi:transcriptional regulator with XRE-family HTH domain
MPGSRDLDPAASVLAFFGAELRRLRADADLSQEQLADRVNYSAALVGMIETARRMPSRDFADRADDALQTGGVLARLWPLVTRDVLPTWFRPWVQEVESEASMLRSWEPLIVPGLLQIRDYARALLGARPDETEEGLEQRLAARLERQEILSRETPPHLWFLMDEAVLHRGIGDAKVMREQLLHVEEMSHHPRVVVQIVPSEAGAHPGLLGAFVIAGNNTDTVYLETAAAGQITELPSVVEEITLTWEALRSEALPHRASRELIARVAEERWT